MTPQEFVNVIKSEVLESATDSMVKILQNSPGRSPSKELLEMSNWYNSLTENDRNILLKIIAKTSRTAVFGFLCVLDGVRAIESNNKGVLKLYYERDGETFLLNDVSLPLPLHDML